MKEFTKKDLLELRKYLDEIKQRKKRGREVLTKQLRKMLHLH